MVDPGEQVSLTLQREFSEEALNSLSLPPSKKGQIHERITKLFKSPGIEVSTRWRLTVYCYLSVNTWLCIENLFLFSFRSIKATWMILETLIMLGWRQLPWISTTTQVHVFAFQCNTSQIQYAVHQKKKLTIVPIDIFSLNGSAQHFCGTMTCLCCYCRRQCERAATASWWWRRTSPMGWCWLVSHPLCKSFLLPGGGCQREESPLVTRDKRLLWFDNEETLRATLAQFTVPVTPILMYSH